MEPHNGSTEFHFTTQAAIYTVLTADMVGLAVHSLRRALCANNGRYVGKKCTVQRFPLYGKEHKNKHTPQEAWRMHMEADTNSIL